MSSLEHAESHLLSIAEGDPARALALLEALESGRKDRQYIRYWQPHPHLERFWAALRPEQDTWLVLGGNGSGKTELGAFLVGAWMLGKDYFRGEANERWVNALPIPAPPANVRAVGLNSDMLRDPVWEKLTGHAEHGPFIPDDSIAQKLDHQFILKTTNGSKLQGKSADVDPKTHGGASCSLVWLDEECSYEIFKENKARTRKAGGKLLVTATPLDDPGTAAHPWIFDLIQQAEDGDPSIGVVYMDMAANPYLSQEFRDAQTKFWTGTSEEQARLHGRPVRRSGLVYPQWTAKPPLWVDPHPLDEKAYRVLMLDPASSGPVAAMWSAFDEKGKWTIYRTYKQGGLTASAHVENILALNGGDHLNMMLMDPYMGQQRLAWHAEHGDTRTVLDIFRQAGLPRLRLADVDEKVALEESREYLAAGLDPTNPHPAVEVFNTCAEFRAEIERYVIEAVVRGPSRGESRDRPRRGNDDVMACFRYTAGMRFRAYRFAASKLVDPAFRSYAN